MHRDFRTSTTAAVLLCLALGRLADASGAQTARVAFDFERGDLQGWTVAEGKLGAAVPWGKLVPSTPGARLDEDAPYCLTTLDLRSKRGRDALTGVLESPVFVLAGNKASFLISGGRHRDTYVALCTLDGREALLARGQNNDAPRRVTWNLRRLVGQRLYLRIVDRQQRRWGHITFGDFTAAGRLDPEGSAQRAEARRRAAAEKLAATFQPLRLAVDDLIESFGTRYPKGRQFLARLDAIQQKATAPGADPRAWAKELESLRREALVANPMVSGHPMVFVVRRQYRGDHHNTATMFQTDEINTGSFTGGSALKTIDLATGNVTTLLDLPKGVVRDAEVRFDARKIVFAMRRDTRDDYHLYEINAHGSGLRQLTFGPGVADFDPLYLPSGQIAFSSTREPKYCMCNRHIMGNLFRMDADGANITQIGHSTLHEGHGSLTPDGRILYDRWEYVDRNFGDAQGLWTCNPDGTNHQIYLMNHTSSPGAVLDARVVPGTEQVIANFSSCHDRPWGALALCDRRRGIDGRSPVLRTWPPDAINLVEQGNYDTFKRVKPKYEDPYPLVHPDSGRGGTYFLCSRQVRGEQMGIVLLDLFGNETLLHTEAPGCFDPIPLAPVRKPVDIPDRIDLAKAEGTFYVHDVYVGLGMEKVKRGTIKYLRVVESPEKRFWTRPAWNGSGTQAPGMAWNDFNNKRILGTAPVEPDGSAHFSVPADRFIYFQLLDENGMMVQSMRSGTIARPGEVTGCVGCHESRLAAVANRHKLAYTRPPSKLEPWYGPPRLFNYLAEVQPVFDKHCVSCHDFGKKDGQKLNLAGDLTLAFNVSYMELRRKNLVRVPGAGPHNLLPALSWGSHASKLVQALRKDHYKVKLSKEDFDRIVTWIDINAPYYPDYASAYPNNLHGRSPLDGRQLAELGKLVGQRLNGQSHTPRISLTRPELSPCLSRLKSNDDPRTQRALAIIQAGKAMLAERPRADMPGFRYLGLEAKRQAKYVELAEAEAEARKAIVQGKKLYHATPSP